MRAGNYPSQPLLIPKLTVDKVISLKKEIMEKVPPHMREEHSFYALLDHVKKNKIATAEHLLNYLNQERALVETWLKDNQNRKETMTKNVRDKVIQLGVLRKCLELTQQYLV